MAILDLQQSAPIKHSHGLGSSNVHFPQRAPLGYHANLIKYAKNNLLDLTDIAPEEFSETLEYLKEQNWQEKVGLDAAVSPLFITIPVYNEETSIHSLSSALELSNIPRTVPMTIVVITNACTDNSAEKIEAYLQNQQNYFQGYLDNDLGDCNIREEYSSAQLDSWTLLHFSTSTPGKSNVWNIANQFALLNNLPIVLSIDADAYPLPDAITNLFARSYKEICDKANGANVISGLQTEEILPEATGLIAYLSKRKKNSGIDTEIPADKTLVNGKLCAWSSMWYQEQVGSIPPIAAEDRLIGILSNVLSYQEVVYAEDAITSSYKVSRVQDLLNVYARSIRARLQMVDLYGPDSPVGQHIAKTYPRHFAIFGGEDTFLQGLNELKDILLSKNADIRKLPKNFFLWLIYEVAFVKAQRDFRKNPSDGSWEKTKAR